MALRNFAETAVLLHENDNVAVLKRPLKAGDELVFGSLPLNVPQGIAAGHKIALRNIPADDPVIKYGQIIGFALTDIHAGEHVHSHNVVLKEFGRDYQFCVDARPFPLHPAQQMRFFQGYRVQMAAREHAIMSRLFPA